MSDTPETETKTERDAPDDGQRTTGGNAAVEAFEFIKTLGPRGVDGLFGWTFFDPANLICVSLMLVSTWLSVSSMRERGAPDWYMPFGLYLCLAAFMRGYFFNYYNGKLLSRILVWLVLVLGFLATGFLWEDRAQAHDAVRTVGRVHVEASPRFHVAALLHVVIAVTLTIHYLLPRRFLIKYTDEVADMVGRENATGAPGAIAPPEDSGDHG